MTNTNGHFEIPLVSDVLEGERGARFVPTVFFCRKPVVEALLKGIQFDKRCIPGD